MGGVNNIDFSTADVESAVNLADDVSPTMPGGARGAIITIAKSQVRMRDDSTDPTTSIGHILEVGDVVTFNSWRVPRQNWRQVMKRTNFIQGAANTTGAINVSWYD